MNTFRTIPMPFRIVFIGLIAVAAIAIAMAAHFNSQLQALKNPNAATEAEVKATVAQVAKLMVLPQSEVPTVATVSDPEKLKDQPFFANAISGDKVLIYSIAKKAILWRPSIAKIIEVSPLNIPAQEAPKK